MEIISWEDIGKYSEFFKKGSALTVGSFDGPHRGHDLLFDAVRKFAVTTNLASGVVTFKKSASVFHAKSAYRGDVSSLRQRLEVFEKRGLSFVILIDFSGDFIKIKGNEFLAVLLDSCNMKFIAEGVDFRCGYKGATGRPEIAAFCQTHGLEAVFCDDVIEKGKRISSTRIRDCVKNDNLKEASLCLGRNFAVDAKCLDWQNVGEGIQALVSDCTQVLPSAGCYEVLVKDDDSNFFETKFFVESKYLRLDFPHEQIDTIEFI